MRKIDVEAWARRVIDMVLEGNRVEDSRVELKAHFPGDHPHIPEDVHVFKHARQLAGHANAARGAELLWLFGLDDEANCITDVATDKREHWYQRISSKFESLVPELLECLTIDHADGVVVAFYFGTERAPYLVNNPKGGRIDYEVPWREDNTTRTAKRRDLVRVLVPVQKLPGIELLHGEIEIQRRSQGGGFLKATAKIYIEPFPGDSLFLPFHRLQLMTSFISPEELESCTVKYENAKVGKLRREVRYESATISCGPAGVLVSGPGVFEFCRQWEFPNNLPAISNGPSWIRFLATPSHQDRHVEEESELHHLKSEGNRAYWRT
ncbi:hypothetical protein FIV42_00745 [Persicimonas caeni]|uniref:Uncharacterized protein n=1 Tax=Persicimonas caeni TaxID=2292766 RepID=A0A4Y6PM21_PERCE|nr:hypothetical protein [Persicimonas caeni]QDG49312.1 hypothetical protein FIV42_00745 [Persicimonas caeni]QED30533.1 hypothetical protein FRD00_00740 [Persicimonas caeni]